MAAGGGGDSVEKIEIREGTGSGFALVWSLLLLVFAVSLTVLILGVIIITAMTATRQFKGSDFIAAISALASFNGKRIVELMKNSTGAGAAIVFLGGAVLTVATRALFKLTERSALHKKAVTPLLPTKKRSFIPTDEGLYTRAFRNIVTGTAWYRLRPWASLQLDLVDPKHHRIAVRDGKAFMYLRSKPAAGVRQGTAEDARQVSGGYEEVRDLVLDRLPEGNRTPVHRPPRFGWIPLGICVIVLFVAVSAGYRYLDARATGTVGDHRCDVCGRGFGLFYMKEMAGDKVVHEYCDLHGMAYAFVTPATAWRSAASVIPEIARKEGLSKAIAQNMGILNALTAWWLIGCVVLVIVLPKPLMLDR